MADVELDDAVRIPRVQIELRPREPIGLRSFTIASTLVGDRSLIRFTSNPPVIARKPSSPRSGLPGMCAVPHACTALKSSALNASNHSFKSRAAGDSAGAGGADAGAGDGGAGDDFEQATTHATSSHRVIARNDTAGAAGLLRVGYG